jgi:ribonuclease HI
LRAWKDICTPKKEGGLGIRNFQAVNQGLILMAAWRIAQNPNDFLHQILKAKYFYDSSIWRPNPNVPKSAFWASILKVLPILKSNSFYQITQGNISLWSSPWCKDWTRIYDNLIIQQPNYNYPAKVNDLWLPNQQAWDDNLIDSLFQQPMAQCIKQTPIIPSYDQDLLCWKLTSHGKCDSKSAYYACLQRLQELGEPQPRQVCTATTNLLNQVWKSRDILPRIQAFAWRFLRKAIPTGARAGKYSKHISKFCCRCGLQEDDVHLFFTCHFVKAAWFSAPWYLRTEIITQNTHSLTHILLNMLNLPHPYASLRNILTFMWCIWKSRNDCLFHRKKGEPYQININAQALQNNMELLDPSVTSSLQILPRQMQIKEQHEFPEQGETLTSDRNILGAKIFSDASWKRKKVPADYETTGIGVFIQFDINGLNYNVMIQASVPLASSVLQAEAKAMLLAAQIAEKSQISRPTMLTDNKLLAKAVASMKIDSVHMHWNTRDTLARILNTTSKLQARVFHIKRDLNGVAHKCVHQVLRNSLGPPLFGCSSLAHTTPSCLAISVLQDSEWPGFVIHDVQCC